MKKTLCLLAAAVALCTACSNNNQPGPNAEPPELKSLADTLAWAYGQNIADVLQRGMFASLDADLILQSAHHALAGGRQPFPPEVTMQALEFIATSSNQIAAQQDQNQRMAVDEKQEAYFSELQKSNSKVKRHPSGFYYEVMKEGKGPKAKLAQRIKFDYRGKLMFTGEAFDQTYGKREPIMHVVGEPMFPGLIEAFQLMNPGSIYRFYFPYQLAFGAAGGGTVPGYTPLIYEVELHETYDD